MSEFSGDLKSFHDYVGPRIRNKINVVTKKIKDSKKRICEHCKEEKDLESAHIHGIGRRDIIEKVLINYTKNGKISGELKLIENEIIKAHYPLEQAFIFICRSCHRVYDRKCPTVKVRRMKTASKNKESAKGKLNKIMMWSKRPHQKNSQIIACYIEKLNKDRFVTKVNLELACLPFMSSKQFLANFNSMKTNSGNNHGQIFYEIDELVYFHSDARKEIEKFWHLS